mmetsp:Transcript_22353/g.62372  ORF Transcript_22353/g.62372 Transcript_22353/m.62372 type:complete len:127 (-) Transcript_22353:392-772(-)
MKFHAPIRPGSIPLNSIGLRSARFVLEKVGCSDEHVRPRRHTPVPSKMSYIAPDLELPAHDECVPNVPRTETEMRPYRLGMRFLKESGKHDIHHLPYQISSSSSVIPLGGCGGGVGGLLESMAGSK